MRLYEFWSALIHFARFCRLWSVLGRFCSILVGFHRFCRLWSVLARFGPAVVGLVGSRWFWGGLVGYSVGLLVVVVCLFLVTSYLLCAFVARCSNLVFFVIGYLSASMLPEGAGRSA